VTPNELIVGFDALAVFIHPDNPADSFTLAQLADIYSENGTTESWSQLGITVPDCNSDEIVRVSRQNSSGTYVYFQEAILGDSDYKLGSLDMAGSSEVVDLVEKTPCAIGYSGLAYATEDVKIPCLMSEESANCVAPSTASAIDGTYPIARPLFMYTNGQPEGVTKEYIDWILSDQGQCIILNKGYAPVRNLACN
jgi:phosphate transport system substrate-binding protein